MFTIRTAVRVFTATATIAVAFAASAQAGEHKPTPAPSKPVPHRPGPMKPVEAVKSPRDVASGQATGKRQHQQLAVDPKTKLNNVKPGTATATLKPGVGQPVTALNDAGTRPGGSLAGQGAIDMLKGIKKIATGNTEGGFKLFDHGSKTFLAGVDGDPSNNGPKLNDDKKGGKGKGEDEEGESGK